MAARLKATRDHAVDALCFDPAGLVRGHGGRKQVRAGGHWLRADLQLAPRANRAL